MEEEEEVVEVVMVVVVVVILTMKDGYTAAADHDYDRDGGGGGEMYLVICLPTKFHYLPLNGSGVARFQASAAVRIKSLLRSKTLLLYFFCLINLQGSHTEIITGYLKIPSW